MGTESVSIGFWMALECRMQGARGYGHGRRMTFDDDGRFKKSNVLNQQISSCKPVFPISTCVLTALGNRSDLLGRAGSLTVIKLVGSAACCSKNSSTHRRGPPSKVPSIDMLSPFRPHPYTHTHTFHQQQLPFSPMQWNALQPDARRGG